jgi:hypothetical protein
MDHKAGEPKHRQKGCKDVRRREAQSLEVLVRRNDDVVAQLGGVEEAACETGDQRQSEPTEKYEQICESPGHWCIITTHR